MTRYPLLYHYDDNPKIAFLWFASYFETILSPCNWSLKENCCVGLLYNFLAIYNFIICLRHSPLFNTVFAFYIRWIYLTLRCENTGEIRWSATFLRYNVQIAADSTYYSRSRVSLVTSSSPPSPSLLCSFLCRAFCCSTNGSRKVGVLARGLSSQKMHTLARILGRHFYSCASYVWPIANCRDCPSGRMPSVRY